MRLEYVVNPGPGCSKVGWITPYVLLSLTHRIAIYSLDSVIRPLYNWAQVVNKEMTHDSAKSYVEKLEFD